MQSVTDNCYKMNNIIPYLSHINPLYQGMHSLHYTVRYDGFVTLKTAVFYNFENI